ncbi:MULTISPECIES: radical SAM protein [Dehalococcoides]|nr:MULTISPECIES: radical SAM protein [Dehalococcoides]AGG05745.1 radical SAM domain-containing protein [Dehalococcoides mccartyi DCMB5]BEL00216.1 GTP 3',8-cyclase MoaA [Dehalococcoides mccartyi]
MNLSDTSKESLVNRSMPFELSMLNEKTSNYILKPSPQTNIYHISYTPQTKEVSLFFWGCNFCCLGCLSKKEIRNYLLPENIHLFGEDSVEIAQSPEQFLNISDVLRILKDLDIQTVLFEGQEPSLDSSLPELAKLIHSEFKTQNILCSNINKLISLDDIDRIQLSLKAITDSLHMSYTGKSNKSVLHNFKKLYMAGKDLSITSVLIPDYIEQDEIEKISKFISNIDRDLPFNILPYFKAGKNQWRCPNTNEMEAAELAAKKYLSTVYAWRGNEKIKYDVMKVF